MLLVEWVPASTSPRHVPLNGTEQKPLSAERFAAAAAWIFRFLTIAVVAGSVAWNACCEGASKTMASVCASVAIRTGVR